MYCFFNELDRILRLKICENFNFQKIIGIFLKVSDPLRRFKSKLKETYFKLLCLNFPYF